MEVLATISKYENYFNLVIKKVLDMFNAKQELIEVKGTVIFRKLSSFLDPEKLFVTIAQTILKFEVPLKHRAAPHLT